MLSKGPAGLAGLLEGLDAQVGDDLVDFGRQTLKGGIEADIFDELLGSGKAVDVADDGSQGKGDETAHAAEPHQGEQKRIIQDFLGDQSAPVCPLFIGMAQCHEHPFIVESDKTFIFLIWGWIKHWIL